MDILIKNEMNELEFEAIVNLHYDEIFYYVMNQLNDVEETKDMTQDIFIKVYHNLSRYNSQKSSIRTWIYRIAHHHCLDYFKSAYYKAKLKNIQFDLDIETNEDLLNHVINHERVEWVIYMMKKYLNKKHQKIMNMYIFSELSVKEITEIIKIPEKTIYNVINHSIKKLKEMMEGELYG